VDVRKSRYNSGTTCHRKKRLLLSGRGCTRAIFFIVATARALATKTGPFHRSTWGLPPLIICSATARTNILYCKAWKEIDTLPVRAFGAGTLRSHAYNDILSHQERSSTLRYHLSLRLRLTSPIWILSFLFFSRPFWEELGAFLNMTQACFEPLPQMRCKLPLCGERGVGDTTVVSVSVEAQS
jgi:hypothetical protein